MAKLYGPGPEPAEPLRPVGDMAGLPVDDAAGRPAGEVYGALAEARSGLIRYVDLQLAGSDRHVLVPVGHTRVRRAHGQNRLHLRAATREDLSEIPPYEVDPEQLDDRYQRMLLTRYGRLFYGERYYAHPAFDHSGLYAGEHPIVREPTPAAPAPTGLLPLSDLPAFRVVEQEPDIRGWPVRSGKDEHVGRLADLMVDPDAHRVRYAVVEADDGVPRRTLLPVGFLQIDARTERVRLPVLTAEDVRALPAYNPDRPITRTDEDRLRHSLEARLDGRRRFQRPDFSPA